MPSQIELVLFQLGRELIRSDLNFVLVEPFDEHVLVRLEDCRGYERVYPELLNNMEQIDFGVQFGASFDKHLVVDGLFVPAAGTTALRPAAPAQTREASPVVHNVVLKRYAP